MNPSSNFYCITYLVYDGFRRNRPLEESSHVTQVQLCGPRRVRLPERAPTNICNGQAVSDFLRVPELNLGIVICGRRRGRPH